MKNRKLANVNGYQIIGDSSIIEPRIPSLIHKAKDQIPWGNDFIEEEIAFPKMIGKNLCVETTSQDEVFYALRPGRKGYTRFVKNRYPKLTKKMFLRLKKDSENKKYYILSAYFGERTPMEPHDNVAINRSEKDSLEIYEESLTFWSTHALVTGELPIVAGSQINYKPW